MNLSRSTVVLAGLLASVCGIVRTEAITAEGSCVESFSLVNKQTKSPTFGQTVSSQSYLDRATVYMILASG